MNQVSESPVSKNLANRCVLIIDESARSSTFFRHRDVNYLNTFEKESITPDRIRQAVIGGIRFGKQLVIDLMDNQEMLNIFKTACDELDSQLYNDLLDRSIIKDSKYMRLVRESDGEEYGPHFFDESLVESFQTIFLFEGSKSAEENLMNLGITYKIIN
jgi:hypothetical protein